MEMSPAVQKAMERFHKKLAEVKAEENNMSVPKLHDLKCWPEFFQPVVEGIKTVELRQNDRDFKVGDHLHLREWQRNGAHGPDGTPLGDYTGRTTVVKITHIVHARATVDEIEGWPNNWLCKGIVALSIHKVVGVGGNC